MSYIEDTATRRFGSTVCPALGATARSWLVTMLHWIVTVSPPLLLPPSSGRLADCRLQGDVRGFLHPAQELPWP